VACHAYVHHWPDRGKTPRSTAFLLPPLADARIQSHRPDSVASHAAVSLLPPWIGQRIALNRIGSVAQRGRSFHKTRTLGSV
jgi:hypothetical protein